MKTRGAKNCRGNRIKHHAFHWPPLFRNQTIILVFNTSVFLGFDHFLASWAVPVLHFHRCFFLFFFFFLCSVLPFKALVSNGCLFIVNTREREFIVFELVLKRNLKKKKKERKKEAGSCLDVKHPAVANFWGTKTWKVDAILTRGHFMVGTWYLQVTSYNRSSLLLFYTIFAIFVRVMWLFFKLFYNYKYIKILLFLFIFNISILK